MSSLSLQLCDGQVQGYVCICVTKKQTLHYTYIEVKLFGTPITRFVQPGIQGLRCVCVCACVRVCMGACTHAWWVCISVSTWLSNGVTKCVFLCCLSSVAVQPSAANTPDAISGE